MINFTWTGAVKLLSALFWIPIASEIFMRIFAPVPMLPRYIESAPFGIRANMRSQDYWHRTPDYSVNLRTNSVGFRADQEFALEKPSGVKRIIVLGDSFGMGYGVDLENTSVSRLEQRLAEEGIRSEVINLSVSGHGNAEELIMLEEVGLAYDPDLVLLYWHASDYQDNVRSGLFELDGSELVRAAPEYLPAVELREFLYGFAAYGWVAGNSQFYNWSRDSAAVLAKRLFAASRSKNSDGERSPSESNQDDAFPIARDEDASSDEETELESRDRLALALLRRMQSVAGDEGARFLVLAVPRRRSRTEFNYPFPFEAGDTSHGLAIVDPIPEFERHHGELLYWERSHGHWTPLGCELVGDVLADRILSDELLAD